MAETEPKTRQTEEGGAASVTEVLRNANEDIDPKTQKLLNERIAPQIDAMFAKQNAIIDNQNATISELQKALDELKGENERLRKMADVHGNANPVIEDNRPRAGVVMNVAERARRIDETVPKVEQGGSSESHADFLSQYLDVARDSLYGKGGVFASANTRENSASRSSEASMDTGSRSGTAPVAVEVDIRKQREAEAIHSPSGDENKSKSTQEAIYRTPEEQKHVVESASQSPESSNEVDKKSEVASKLKQTIADGVANHRYDQAMADLITKSLNGEETGSYNIGKTPEDNDKLEAYITDLLATPDYSKLYADDQIQNVWERLVSGDQAFRNVMHPQDEVARQAAWIRANERDGRKVKTDRLARQDQFNTEVKSMTGKIKKMGPIRRLISRKNMEARLRKFDTEYADLPAYDDAVKAMWSNAKLLRTMGNHNGKLNKRQREMFAKNKATIDTLRDQYGEKIQIMKHNIPPGGQDARL